MLTKKKSSACEIVRRILVPTLTRSHGSNAIKMCINSLPLLIVGVGAAEASLTEPWAFAAQPCG